MEERDTTGEYGARRNWGLLRAHRRATSHDKLWTPAKGGRCPWIQIFFSVVCRAWRREQNAERLGERGTGDSRTGPVRSSSSGFLSTLMHSQDPDLLDFLSSAVKPARRLGGFNRKHWGCPLRRARDGVDRSGGAVGYPSFHRNLCEGTCRTTNWFLSSIKSTL